MSAHTESVSILRAGAWGRRYGSCGKKEGAALQVVHGSRTALPNRMSSLLTQGFHLVGKDGALLGGGPR